MTTVVDAQVHIWQADTPARPWPAGGTALAHRPQPVGAAETLRVLDAAGVHRAVLVPPSWEGDRNDLALAAAAQHPDRFAVMGRVPLNHAVRLTDWRTQPGMLGIRVTLHRDPWRSAFRRGELDWLWTAASEANLPVMVYAPGLCADLAPVARRHPALRLTMDHLAIPVELTGPEAFATLPELLALAQFPNVAVKATALPCHSEQPYPFADLHHPIRQTFEAFGPQRMFWGSDWTRLPCPYRQNLTLFTQELPFLTDPDKAAILGEALLNWLNWQPRSQVDTGAPTSRV